MNRPNAFFLGVALFGTSLGPSLWAQTRAQTPSKPVAKAAKPATTPATKSSPWQAPLQGEARVRHVLNRLAFGPRPGDVEKVEKIGVEAWIEAQLKPAALRDQTVEAKLRSLAYLNASTDRLLLAYAGDDGNIRRFLQQRQQAQKQAANPTKSADKNATDFQQKLSARQIELLEEFEAAGMAPGESAQALGELVSAKLVRAVESERQLQEVLVDFWSNHFNVDVRKNTVRVFKVADDREVVRPHVFGSFREMLGASAKSPAMLIYLDNARSTKAYKTANGQTRGGLNENYARELMELHTLGVDGGYSQQDVTEVARAFTGWSVQADRGRRAEMRGVARGAGRGAERGRRAQQNQPEESVGTFIFRANAHDSDAKTILGQSFPAGGGVEEGERVLDLLVAHPATARFIARKLCVRFIADEPPQSAIDRVARAFQSSKGDLPTVYRALFSSPEFLSQGAYRSKIKSPFEYAVSAVRALNGQIAPFDANAAPNPNWAKQRAARMAERKMEAGGGLQRARLVQTGGFSAREGNRANGGPLLAGQIAAMGQPIFACQPPTGYPEISTAWVSSSALVSRLNFAIALSGGAVRDVSVPREALRTVSFENAAETLIGTDLSVETRRTIEATLAQNTAQNATREALLLGSPEFQRR